MKDYWVSHNFYRLLNSGFISACLRRLDARAEASNLSLVFECYLLSSIGGESSNLALWCRSFEGFFILMIWSIYLLFFFRNSRFYSSFCSIWRLLCFNDSIKMSSCAKSGIFYSFSRSSEGAPLLASSSLSIALIFSFWEGVYMKSYLWRSGSLTNCYGN